MLQNIPSYWELTGRVHTSTWLSIEIQSTNYLYDMSLDFAGCCNHYVLVTVDNAITICILYFRYQWLNTIYLTLKCTEFDVTNRRGHTYPLEGTYRRDIADLTK